MAGRQYIAEVEQNRQMSASVPAASHAGMYSESSIVFSAPLQHISGKCVRTVQRLFESAGLQHLCCSGWFVSRTYPSNLPSVNSECRLQEVFA